MASILGIVGSARPWGNSELMVRQVLRGAQAEGASVQMIRLTNLRLESCTGCMRCAIAGKPCRLRDDMAWLVDAVQPQTHWCSRHLPTFLDRQPLSSFY